jgi:uncharacterized protein (TIGR03067 family)
MRDRGHPVRHLSVLLLVLAVPAAVRAEGPSPEPPADAVALTRGTWEVTRVVCRGSEVDTSGRQFARFEKDTLVMGVKGRPKKYRCRLDPKKRGVIDIDLIQDRRFWPGIYKLEKGTLTFAVNNPGEARPTRFDRSVAFIYHLRRVKK